MSVFKTEGGGSEWLGDEITAVALKAAKQASRRDYFSNGRPMAQ